MTNAPRRLSKGIQPFRDIYNALVDFVLKDRVLVGAGLRVTETQQGRSVSVSSDILAAVAGIGPSTPGNPGGGGGGGNCTCNGTGLPDTGTDEDGNPTDPNGNPLDWQTLNVCVSDGEGGWTPMRIGVYASLYTP
jgi:hypothetical protein